MPLPIEFTKKWLILCEGSADKAFFCELIKKRGLPDFQVQYPLRKTDDTGGWSKYGHFLATSFLNEEFKRTVKAVLVTGDNNGDPAARFGDIQRQLRQAGGYGVPEHQLEVARTDGFPDVVIAMLPLNGQPGCLEDSLIEAAYSRWDLREAIDQYMAQTPASGWSPNKKAKTRMQCLIAATCKQNPNSPLAYLWSKNEDYHIPLDHQSFDGIANVLQEFEGLLAPG